MIILPTTFKSYYVWIQLDCSRFNVLVQTSKYRQSMKTNAYLLGICYGFQVMDKEESPNVPFTIFRRRFNRGVFLEFTQITQKII